MQSKWIVLSHAFYQNWILKHSKYWLILKPFTTFTGSDKLVYELLYVYVEIENNRNVTMSSTVSTHVEYTLGPRGY